MAWREGRLVLGSTRGPCLPSSPGATSPTCAPLQPLCMRLQALNMRPFFEGKEQTLTLFAPTGEPPRNERAAE